MKAIESIKKALDYIEEHLSEEINIKKLAIDCYLSVFYFHKLFRDTTGYSVEQYIKLRRLAYSTKLLDDNKLVSDVALRCGFKSSEHFSRTFKETYKILPSEFKKIKHPLFHAYKPDVMLSNTKLNIGDRYISDNILLEIKLREQQEIKTVGLKIFCPFGIETTGIDNPAIAWKKFHNSKNIIKNQTIPHKEFGISCNHNKEGFNYIVSVGVDNISDVPENMVTFTIPKGLYACCIFENKDFETAVGQNLKLAMDYFFSWISKNSYSPKEYFAVEYYSEEAFKESYKIEIWVNINR